MHDRTRSLWVWQLRNDVDGRSPIPQGTGAGKGRRAALVDFKLAQPHIAPVTALVFDTLRLSRALRDKGHFTSEQADALAEALGEAAHEDGA
jgi:hypothetical protein